VDARLVKPALDALDRLLHSKGAGKNATICRDANERANDLPT
jgi:hypothetical protein